MTQISPSPVDSDRIAVRSATSYTGVDYTPPLIICLAQLANDIDHPLSREALLAGMPRDATTDLSACLKAAEQAGLETRSAYRKELSQINPLVLPCILLLNNDNACILHRLDPSEAVVCFAEAPETTTKVPLDALQQEYLGYAVFVQSTGQLDARASDLKLHDTKQWFWGTIAKFWPIYKHVILATLTVNILAIAAPLFTMNVYDRVVPNNAIDTLWVLAIGVMIAYLFDFILRNLRGYFVDTAGKNADVIITGKLMQHLMGIRLDQKPESTGSLANNLREFESLREFFSSTTLLAIVDLPFIAIFVAIIAYIAGPLALVPVIAIPIVILIGLFIQAPFQRFVEKSYREATQKNALLYEIIGGLEAIKTSQAAGPMQKRWEKIVGMNARSSINIRALATFSMTTAQLATQLVGVGIIVWGVYRIAEGELTMGGLIACNILVGRAMSPLGAVAAMLTRLQQSRIALKSLDLLMQIPSERQSDSNPVRHEELTSSICFENVIFQYPGSETQALKELNLTIRPGEKVGIIGRVGSGKSTLGRLILGLYQPQQGMIKVGDIDIRQLDVADLRRKIGYTAQDGCLFYGSVRDNIALGNPFADDRAIIKAAQDAGAFEFIKNHPSGFGLQVGEGGRCLSGGQRQAVSIARTLLQQPDILVMDEPTNSMDNATESAFRQRLSRQSGNRTLVMITHRSSMLELVDRLIVLENGRIVADGPKQQVLSALQNKSVRAS
jgi:ATP-binding cassette subfamily C protein LapB